MLELLKNPAYKESFQKLLQPTIPTPDVVNLEEERPEIYLGSLVQNKNDDNPPPFYLSLNIHDKLLHNYLLDSGASHNPMPKKLMEELGLQVTKEYHDLYTFDSKKVQCMGVIKDLVFSLSQLPMKSVVMDIVVADIPTRFRMLPSRSWSRKLCGTLQMDMSYATIPVFGGEFRRLYRETQRAYIINDHLNPSNHPIYAKEMELGSSVLHFFAHNVVSQSIIKINQNESKVNVTNEEENKIWKLFFDGASSREGSGAGIVLISPTQQVVTVSYKLQFQTSNNTAEYEALILGMKVAKDLGVEQLVSYGDSELVIQQVKDLYKVKYPKLKNYRDEVRNLVDLYFSAFNL